MSKALSSSIAMKVRDYECDMQGIVNNAVYQNYLEHARHEYLVERGMDFAEITRSGVHLVVVRVELDYKKPLKSGGEFRVISTLERLTKLRFVFQQQIVSQNASDVYLNGEIFCASLNAQGRPARYLELDKLFAPT